MTEAVSAPAQRLSVTAIILTWNEELHIARAIACLNWCERVIVCDSGSTDRTVDLARAHGAEVIVHPFDTHAAQFNRAMAQAQITSAWTLRLDADEVIEPDLVARLAELFPSLPPEVTGIAFKRRHVFMGRWVRYGGRWPVVLLRCWRTGTATAEPRWMDEHTTLHHGRMITIDGGFADINLKDSAAFIAKHNRYASLEAVERLVRAQGLGNPQAANRAGPAVPQARFKRWLKHRFYNRLPAGLGPVLYFAYRMIVRGGLFDSPEGRAYHVLQGLWYRYLVELRTREFARALSEITTSGPASLAAKRARLAELAGVPEDTFALL